MPADYGSRDISCRLVTFARWEHIAPRVAAWLNAAYEALVRPCVPDWEKGTTARSRRASEFGDPWGLWIRVEVGETPEASSMFRFSNSILRESIESIRAGEHRVFRLAVSQLDGSGRPASVVCVLELHPGYVERPVAQSLYVSISRDVYGDSRLSEIQERWTTLAKEGARNLDLSYGMITLDHPTGLETPYEERMGIDADDGMRSAGDHVRGYFWANILSSRHISKLGGTDAVRQEAPCHIIETLSEHPHPLIYLQLTPDLDAVSDTDLRRLRNYLSPVLFPGQPSDPYMGPPVRVFVD